MKQTIFNIVLSLNEPDNIKTAIDYLQDLNTVKKLQKAFPLLQGDLVNGIIEKLENKIEKLKKKKIMDLEKEFEKVREGKFEGTREIAEELEKVNQLYY